MPPRGGIIPPFCRGGFIPPKGLFYPPFFGDFIPLLAGGWGLAQLNVNQETQCRKIGCLTRPPPPPVPRNRLVQDPPPGSAVKFSHTFF